MLQRSTGRCPGLIFSSGNHDQRTSACAFQAYGVCVGLQSDSAEVLDAVSHFLPPNRKPADPRAAQRWYILVAESADSKAILVQRPGCRRRLLARSPHWDYPFNRLETDLQIFLGETAPGRVFLHAGVVGWQGAAIVIPGRSFSGKSTLVAALLAAGACYLSDEFAVLDDQGWVHSYSRHLSLRIPEQDRLVRCAADTLGGPSASGPLQPRLFVLARYKPGRRWQPRSVTRGAALMEILRHCLPIRRRPVEALAAIGKALDNSLVLQGDRGEAAEVSREILRRVDDLPGKLADVFSGP